MPQKPLKVGKKIDKKKQAANKHGKGGTTKKGHMEKPPKKGLELERYKENKELSKTINKTNEQNFAAIAQNKGGKLKTLKGVTAPALATKDKAAKDKAAKAAAAKKTHADEQDDMEDDDE